MTKPQTVLEMTRHDAQELHRKISANMAKIEKASWADVKAAQADATALCGKMKTLAADQSEAVKSGITAAITKLQAAGNLVENKTVTAADDVRHANDAMLESAHRAAQSLSAAVASARSKVAKAIEPRKVRA